MDVAPWMSLEVDDQRVEMGCCRVQIIVDAGICQEPAHGALLAVQLVSERLHILQRCVDSCQRSRQVERIEVMRQGVDIIKHTISSGQHAGKLLVQRSRNRRQVFRHLGEVGCHLFALLPKCPMDGNRLKREPAR